jgi:type I restriction enzyme, S subunit
MSWRKVKLGELVENFSVRAKDVGGADGLEFFGVSNETGITTTKYAAEEKAEDYKIIEQGCFAYNPYRVNVGSIGLLTENIKGLISPAYVVFKPKPKSIKPELLLKFLKSSEGLRQIKLYARGTVRQALRFEDLCNIELSLPDYDTQNILLQKLNTTQNCAEQVLAEQSHQLDLIKKLRQQILKDAMQGKLVPQNPKDEPATKLLDKIKAEKTKSGKKEKPLPEIKPGEIPFEIPESWVWCRLGDLTSEILGGYAFDSKKYSKSETNNQIIRLGNVKPNKLVLETSPVFISDNYAKIAEKSKLELGDILITMTGTRAKRDYLFSHSLTNEDLDKKNLFLNQRVGCFRLSRLIDNSYINHSLKESTLLEPVFETSTGAANQANIGIDSLKKILTPLPSYSEQKRIVSKIEELMTLCDALEASIKANQEYTTLLYQTALKEALQPKSIEVKQEDFAIAAEPQAEYEKGKVIELPRLQEKEDSHFVKRKVLATYIINQSLDDQQFGDVKFEKLLHLSDYFAIKRNLGQNYYQKVAGPLDNSFTIPFFEQIEKSKWFNRKRIGRQFQFTKATNHSKSLNTYSYFSEEELAKVQKLIDYFKKSDYEKPEIISTLYAVWNNRIIKQEPITDTLLKQDFLDWDENKAKYKDRLDSALAWMRKEGLVPDGWGKVIEKPKAKKKK